LWGEWNGREHKGKEASRRVDMLDGEHIAAHTDW